MSMRAIEPTAGLRLLEPGPTVMLTSMFRSHPNVMTAAWLSPLSFDPPLITVSIHPGRLTHDLVSKSEMFGVNVPTMDQVRAVHYCGTHSGHELDKFEAAGLTPIDPHQIEAPGIAQCVARIELGVVERFSLADHDLFVGQILYAEADTDYFNDRWVAEDELTLVHHLGADKYAGMTRAYTVSLDDEEQDAEE